jgi:hypothetical protein
LRLVEERYQEPEEAAPVDRIGQRLEILRRLSRKLEAMPTSSVADSLTNRDHDLILYRQ